VIELLGMLDRGREPADQLAGRFLRERRYLGARDRRFISELYFDVLRHRALLEYHARCGLVGASAPAVRRAAPVSEPDERPEGGMSAAPGPIGLLTAHQLHLAGETAEGLLPDVADLWRMAGVTGDVRACVEAIGASTIAPSILEDPVGRMSLQYSIAADIVREWIERFGQESAERLCRASNEPAPTTIRVNTLRCTREECRAALAGEGIGSAPTRYSRDGLVLEKRVNAGALESFRGGMFEMQDEGSQLISLLADPRPGQTVVDACAGGGGKSLHMAALMRGKGIIHAFDPDAVRLRSLRARSLRSGVKIIRDSQVAAETGSDPLAEGGADVVLIDAPCSGVGTYRRNPGAKHTFTASRSHGMSELQHSLLERYSRLVTPGGRLVYSTCTLLRRENETVVERFLQRHPNFTLCAAAAGRMPAGLPGLSDGYLLLLPHQTGTDGFFAAVMERSRSL
jgi:16S rRNA (cytosine967-C5)-methyltransferase